MVRRASALALKVDSNYSFILSKVQRQGIAFFGAIAAILSTGIEIVFCAFVSTSMTNLCAQITNLRNEFAASGK